MKSFKRFVAIAAAASVAAIGLGAVGASAQSSGKGTVKVGSIMPVDSAGLSLEDRAISTEASIKAFNKRGGINGQKIEWILCDYQGDPNKEADCARQMVDEGVVATVNDSTIANSATTAQILGDAGIARIGMLPSGAVDYSSAVAFPMYAGPVGQFGAFVKFLVDQGVSKIAIVSYDTAGAKALPTLMEPEIKNQGAELATTVYIPQGATDYSQFIAQAQSAGADGALLMLNAGEATQMIKAATQLSWDVKFGLTTSSWSVKEIRPLGKLVKSAVYGDANPTPTDSVKRWPGLKQFLADMKAFDKKLTPQVLKANQVASWLGVLALVEVTKGLDTVDAAAVLNALNTATDVDLAGLMPPWSPSEKIDHAIFKSISNPFIYEASFNGKVFTTDKKSAIDAYSLWPPS